MAGNSLRVVMDVLDQLGWDTNRGLLCKSNQKIKGRKILTLHHIDGDNENNKLSNLQILCAKCNSLVWVWNIDTSNVESASKELKRKFNLTIRQRRREKINSIEKIKEPNE